MLYNYKSYGSKLLTVCESAVGLTWNCLIRSELKLHVPGKGTEKAIECEKLAGNTVMFT
jgi:hypothetical protein